jgi:hypothetical protein
MHAFFGIATHFAELPQIILDATGLMEKEKAMAAHAHVLDPKTDRLFQAKTLNTQHIGALVAAGFPGGIKTFGCWNRGGRQVMVCELIPFDKLILDAHPVAIQRNSARAVPCGKIYDSILNLKRFQPWGCPAEDQS